MFDFRRITLFCLEKCLSKHKMTIFSKTLGGHGSSPPLNYAYDCMFFLYTVLSDRWTHNFFSENRSDQKLLSNQ